MRISILFFLLPFFCLGQHVVVTSVSNGASSDNTEQIVEDFQNRVTADGGTLVDDCLSGEVATLNSLGVYDNFSFLLLPSAYKTSKVYSIVPTNGVGDLTFSRSSASFTKDGIGFATDVPRVEDCNLLLEPSTTNLLLRSETFDNATWTKSGSTVSANAAVAPDGTTTADKIVETATTAGHGVTQAVSKATSQLPYVIQVYAKAAGTNWLRLVAFQSTNAVEAYFNLATGVKGSSAIADDATRFSLINYGMEDAGNGWYLCWIAFTSSAGNNLNPFIAPTTGDLIESHAGNTSNGIYAWGAKLIQAATPRSDSYIATTTATVTRSADVVSSLTSVSSLIGQTQGTLYLHLKSNSDATSKTFAISDGNILSNLFTVYK